MESKGLPPVKHFLNDRYHGAGAVLFGLLLTLTCRDSVMGPVEEGSMPIKELHSLHNFPEAVLSSLLLIVNFPPGIHESLETVSSPLSNNLSVPASDIHGHLGSQEPLLDRSLGLHKLNVLSSCLMINSDFLDNLSHLFEPSKGSAESLTV